MTGRRWPVRVGALAGVAALAVGLSGCTIGSAARIDTSAVFSDVGTLTAGAQVKLADVPVGSVTGVSLDGARAKVTMSIQPSADVPANVTAKLERSSILGQRYIALALPAHPRGRLRDGTPIARTAVVPTVEQVIGSGAEVFGAISTSDLAAIVTAGGQGLSGEAASLKEFLNDLSTVTAGYASHTAQIATVVDSLDQLGTTLASTAGADAQAITNLSQTAAVLAQESSQFETLLQSLDDLSRQGTTLLSNNLPQITEQLDALHAVAGQLATHQQDLAELLEYLPAHDATMSQSTRNDFLQILNNLIVCGIPEGGSGSTAATSCSGAGK